MRLCINNIYLKYEIAYHNYAEAKRAHRVYSNPAIDIVRSVKMEIIH